MRRLVLATILLASSTAFVSSVAFSSDGSPVLELSAGIDVEAFVAQVLAYEHGRGLNRSTDESLRQVFEALDVDQNLMLDESELSVLNLDPSY